MATTNRTVVRAFHETCDLVSPSSWRVWSDGEAEYRYSDSHPWSKSYIGVDALLADPEIEEVEPTADALGMTTDHLAGR